MVTINQRKGKIMKTETIEFYKLARNQTPKREHLGKREAWQNKAFSGKVNRDSKARKELNKLY